MLKTDKVNILMVFGVPIFIIVLFAMEFHATSKFGVKDVVLISFDSNEAVNPHNISESTKIDKYSVPYGDAVDQVEDLNLIKIINGTKEIYAMQEARELLNDQKIVCVIVIPSDFSDNLERNDSGVIECIPDGSDRKYLQSILNAVQESIRIFVEHNNLTPQFIILDHAEFEIPSSYHFNYCINMTPILAFIIFGVAMILSIFAVVHEKPIPRLLITPTKRHEILTAKYVVFSFLLLLQMIVVYLVVSLTNLYIAGNPADFFIGMFTLGFAGMASGMFISVISNTKAEADQYFFGLFIGPAILSGVFIPLEAMPDYLQTMAYFFPLTHGNLLVKTIAQKGTSFLTGNFFYLIILGFVYVALSFFLFQISKQEVR